MLIIDNAGNVIILKMEVGKPPKSDKNNLIFISL